MPSATGRRALSTRQRLARRSRWRRIGAALLAAAAVVVALSALLPRVAGERGRAVLVVVRDLPAGAVVSAADVEVALRPAATVPATRLTTPEEVIGHVTATALTTHDVVTAERLVGAALLGGQPAGSVAMSVPVLDVGEATRPGVRVDLYATATGETAASDVVVLAVRRPSEALTPLASRAGPQLTVALPADAAARVARSLSGLDGGQGLVVAVRPQPMPPQ
jgi:Flp pilus assembly protein CpaB